MTTRLRNEPRRSAADLSADRRLRMVNEVIIATGDGQRIRYPIIEPTTLPTAGHLHIDLVEVGPTNVRYAIVSQPVVWTFMTEAQTRVVTHLMTGRPHREIAATLGIAERTLKNHLSAIYAATGTSGDAELVNRYWEGFARAKQVEYDQIRARADELEQRRERRRDESQP